MVVYVTYRNNIQGEKKIITSTEKQTTEKDITRTSFYFEQAVLTEFKAACKRQEASMSSVLQEAMKHYISVHSGGRPQLHIDHFNGSAHKNHVCPKCGKPATLLKVRYISGLTGEICKECAEKYRVRGSMGYVKRVLGVA